MISSSIINGKRTFDCPFSLDGNMFFLEGWQSGDAIKYGDLLWTPSYVDNEMGICGADTIEMAAVNGAKLTAYFYKNSLVGGHVFFAPTLDDPGINE